MSLPRLIRSIVRRLRLDQRGSVGAAEFVILVTILAIGMIAGLCAVRWSLIQEFGDVGVALERLDQSYQATIGGVVSSFEDQIILNDSAGVPPDNLCTQAAMSEP